MVNVSVASFCLFRKSSFKCSASNGLSLLSGEPPLQPGLLQPVLKLGPQPAASSALQCGASGAPSCEELDRSLTLNAAESRHPFSYFLLLFNKIAVIIWTILKFAVVTYGFSTHEYTFLFVGFSVMHASVLLYFLHFPFFCFFFLFTCLRLYQVHHVSYRWLVHIWRVPAKNFHRNLGDYWLRVTVADFPYFPD